MTKSRLKTESFPAICTPLTGKTTTEIIEQLEVVLTHSPDVIEWRADFFQDLAHTDVVLQIIKDYKKMTETPLLFTIRAEHEGGEEITLTEQEKVQLLSDVCKKSAVDLVDYETSNEEKYVQEVRSVSKEAGKTLILSYHNFTLTPDNDELMKRAKQVVALDGDIAKFAVMPKSKEDVFRLLEMTKAIDEALDVPVITMSMGDIGGLSRIVGWAYGSVLTFGVGVELSAPGQMPVKRLREAIQITQELVPSWK